MEHDDAGGRPLQGLRELVAEEAVPLTVRGACMEPVLPDGRTVTVEAVRRLWPGDVVAVAVPGRPIVVHRVLGVGPWRGGWRVLTAGDAAPRPDAPVPRAAVLGRVQLDVPLRHRLRAVARFVAIAVAAAARRAGR